MKQTILKLTAAFVASLTSAITFASNDPYGACCFYDNCDTWVCDEMYQSDCILSFNGTHWANLMCTDINCPDFSMIDLGGCCYEDADIGLVCADTKLPECDALGGIWNPGVYCECDPCTPVSEGCMVIPRTNCVGPPQYPDPDYLLFGNGQIAAQTASPSVFGGAVVTVFDLSGTPPLNQNFPTNRYYHSSWQVSTGNPRMGSIFGLAIDELGNLYVSATRTWANDVVSADGWGAVFKIDTNTGQYALFASIPMPNNESSLGSITYDCDHAQFFVSSFEDGLIYRLNYATGNILDSFDHGAPYTGAGGPVAIGDRPWAVEVHDDRLYYSVWAGLIGDPNAVPNEIWSIALDANGAPIAGTEVLEIELPVLPNYTTSFPVADIDFSLDGTMFLAERSQSNIESVNAHTARVLEYECIDGLWTLSTNNYSVGIFSGTNATGGVDATMDRVWASGDALQLGPDIIYGFQGIPVGGGDVTTSVLVDYQGNLTAYDKTLIGDLVCTDEDGGTGDIGVCCYKDDCSSHCDVMTEKDCLSFFAATFFANTTCDQVSCPPPPVDFGACCYIDAGGYLCTNANMYLCDAIQGIWYPGIPCECIPCEPTVETGACCFLDTGSGLWVCYEMTEEDCTDKPQSSYAGDSTVCADTSCCKPIGACCVAGNCLLVSADQCASANGFYYGSGLQCSVVDCSYCPGDLNHDHMVTIDDLLILLGAWGACN